MKIGKPSSKMFSMSLVASLMASGVGAGCGPKTPGTTPQAPPRISMEDFFRKPERAAFQLSDDGKTLSFMKPALGDDGKSKRMNIFVQALDASSVGDARQLTRESARDIAGYG